MTSSRSAIAQLLFVMFLWGSTFVVTKAGLDGLPPVLFAFARISIAALCLLVMAIVLGQWRLPRDAPWRILLTMGLLGIAIYYAAFNLGLQYTSASQAALVQGSLPVVTTGLAVIFLRERLNAWGAIGIILAVAGVGAIFLFGRPDTTAPDPLLGNLITLGAVFAWSAYTVMAKRIAFIEPLTATAWSTAIGAVFLGIGAAIEHFHTPAPTLTAGAAAAVLYLGILPSALSFVLYSHALRRLRASQVAVFINLVPVVGVLAGVVAFGDALSSGALLGGALVLSGVWISTRERSG